MSGDTADEPVRKLDVREIEGEPFDEIVGALGSLPDGGTLLLVSDFAPEPLPQYSTDAGTRTRRPRRWTANGTCGSPPCERVRDIPPSADGSPTRMSGTMLDVREIPPAERHPRVHDAFAALESGETLTIINDHEPKPLFYELRAEVEAFDADGYTVDHRGPEEYVAEFPKR